MVKVKRDDLAQIREAVQFCYVSVIFDRSENFRYDFHIITSIDHYISA
jgi:hypothetical protein